MTRTAQIFYLVFALCFGLVAFGAATTLDDINWRWAVYAVSVPCVVGALAGLIYTGREMKDAHTEWREMLAAKVKAYPNVAIMEARARFEKYVAEKITAIGKLDPGARRWITMSGINLQTERIFEWDGKKFTDGNLIEALGRIERHGQMYCLPKQHSDTSEGTGLRLAVQWLQYYVIENDMGEWGEGQRIWLKMGVTPGRIALGLGVGPLVNWE